MEPRDVVNDIKEATNRIKSLGYADAKKLVIGEVLPLMTALAEATQAQLDEAGEAIALLSGDGDSMIQPELAAQIEATVKIGLDLCFEIEKLTLDELTKKRLTEYIVAYRTSVEFTTQRIAEAVFEEDEEDDDEGSEEDTDDVDEEEVEASAETEEEVQP